MWDTVLKVLVDAKSLGTYDVAYVPQERILPHEDMVSETDMDQVLDIDHPYTYLLFFGMDKKVTSSLYSLGLKP